MSNLLISEHVLANIPKLFKSTAYDIRAYVGEADNFFSEKAVLTPEAMKIAGSLMGLIRFKCEDGSAVFLKEGDFVAVGYDNGPTSKALAYSFADGLNDAGINVYILGVASSGQVYQNQEQLGANGHCQITRSHVEVTTNGAKFGISTQGIHTYLLAQMNEAALNGISIRNCEKGKTIDKEHDARKLYFNKMENTYKAYFSKRDNSSVAINLFGGTGVQYLALFKAIFGENITILGSDIDVNSGKLLADPTRKEMLEKVPNIHKVLSSGKHVHSFDLDADRGSLTEGGDALSLTGEGHYLGDNLAFILADYKMKIALPALETSLKLLNIDNEKIGKILDIAKIVYVDPRYTSSVKSYVDNILNGKTEFHRKGHSLWKESITQNMLQMAKIGGFNDIKEFVSKTQFRDYQIEASLHMFSTDVCDGIPRDDAVENIFILEKIMDELGIKKLSDYFANMPKRFITKEIRTVSITNDIKDKITYDIINHLREKFSINGKASIVEFDGQIRVDWSSGFIMYGMSNTSPKLTFMAEGSTVDERNIALAYLMAIHNDAKKRYNDTLPMDIDENPFFIHDKSYEMGNPDEINSDDKRVHEFLRKFE